MIYKLQINFDKLLVDLEAFRKRLSASPVTS